jgi:hypothetical protein
VKMRRCQVAYYDQEKLSGKSKRCCSSVEHSAVMTYHCRSVEYQLKHAHPASSDARGHKMAWHSINCGDPTLCDYTVQNILQAYDSINHADCLPPGAAIFSRHESRGDLHCELILYFSPEATAVAKAVGAMACNKPPPQGLSLILHDN